jgi:acylphosphatase
MESGPFESVLAALSRAEVRYLVVGGVACALNGFVRTTEDVDILVDTNTENIRRLLDALSHVGEGHALELRVEDFTDEEGAVRLIEDFPIDIFTRMGGRRYADMLPYKRVHDGEVPIPFVDADGLILLKSQSLRPRDRIDVEALRGLRDKEWS